MTVLKTILVILLILYLTEQVLKQIYSMPTLVLARSGRCAGEMDAYIGKWGLIVSSLDDAKTFHFHSLCARMELAETRRAYGDKTWRLKKIQGLNTSVAVKNKTRVKKGSRK